MQGVGVGGASGGEGGEGGMEGGDEDEKERSIAKAALSIAELGWYFLSGSSFLFLSFADLYLLGIHTVALLDGSTTPDDVPPPTITTTADADDTHSTDGATATDGEDSTSTPGITTTVYIPLRSINAVSSRIPFIEDAREKVMGEMQAMVLTGLTTLVRPFPSTFPYPLLTSPSLLP